MKQVIQSYRTGKLRLVDAPVPRCGAGSVLVKNEASLVSIGTERSIIELGKKSLVGKAIARPDLVKRVKEKIKNEGFMKTVREAFGRLDTPTALGYSSAGIVVEVGKDVTKFSPGDRVAATGAGYASHAEYISVPQNLCAKLPGKVSFEAGAFGTLGGIALHGIRQTKISFGERVVVIGLGLLGQLTIRILKSYGCSVIGMDVDEGKVRLARSCGADAVVGREALRGRVERLTGHQGADAVIITASTDKSDPVDLAVSAVRHGGRVVVVGVADIHPNRNEMWEKEVELLVSQAGGPGWQGADYPLPYVRWTAGRNIEEFLALVAEGWVDVTPLISHRFPLYDAEAVYAKMLKGKGGPASPKGGSYVGVIFEYPAGDIPENLGVMRRIARSGVPESRQAKDTIALGVIGAGIYGKALLLPALKNVKGAFLHTLAVSQSAEAHHTGEKYGFREVTTDYRQMLQNKEIDAVIIATPHSTHAQMVIDALKAGKHVFVEKPLCVTEEELTEIAKVYGSLKKPLLLMIGFNRRYSRHTARLKECFAGRTDPEVLHFRANVGFVPKEHWVHAPKEGGGRIIGEMCHYIDFLSYLAGSRVAEAYAERIAGNEQTALANDNAVVTLKFADGSVGSIVYTALGSRAFSRERVEVFADGKAAELADFRRTVCFTEGGKKTLKTASQELGHREELQAFVDAARGETPAWTADEMFASTEATFAVVRALSTGKPQKIS